MNTKEIREVEKAIRDMYEEYIRKLIVDTEKVKEDVKHDAEVHNKAIHMVLDLLCME